MKLSEPFDVIVVGGGPAGSTAAAILAEQGWRVLVLEKTRFPRYKVGESLLPYCFFTLERTGALEAIRQHGFQKKFSAQFVSSDGRLSQPFQFNEHLDHPAAQTWQVNRDVFDQILLQNAAQKGAIVHEETTARSPIMDGDAVVGVTVEDAEGNQRDVHAHITIDASGRDGFFMSRNRWKIPEEALGRFALWAYYRGANHDPMLDDGATTTVSLPNEGWVWYIPLGEERVGVGIVARRETLFEHTREPEQAFENLIRENPWVWERLADAERISDVRVTNDYSYRSRYCATNGLVLTGDAFAFLDPVFSSGVFLALVGAEAAAHAVDAALKAENYSAAQFEEYGDWLRGGIENMRALVYAFYDPEFSFGEILRKRPETKSDITDCLIGNIFRSFDTFLASLSEFADLPAPLPHGKAKEDES